MMIAWLGVAQATCMDVLVERMNLVVAPLAQPGPGAQAVREAIAAGTAAVDASSTCTVAERALWIQTVTTFEEYLVPMTELNAQIAARPSGPLASDPAELARLERGLMLALSGSETSPQRTYTLGPPGNGLSDSSWRMLASHHEAALVRLHNRVSAVTSQALFALTRPDEALDLAAVQAELSELCGQIQAVEPLGGDAALRDSALAECRGLEWYHQEAAPLMREIYVGKRKRRAQRELEPLLERVRQLHTNEEAFRAERASWRARWQLPPLSQQG
jgi:hypothetical protein